MSATLGDPRPVHRVILVADIEKSNRREWTDNTRVRMNLNLRRCIEEVGRLAEPMGGRCERYVSGDSAILLFDIPHKTEFPTVIIALGDAVTRCNEGAADGERMRLRIAVHHGEVSLVADGVVGSDVSYASRLCDSDVLRTALARSAGDLALILSEEFHGIITNWVGGALDAAHCEPVVVMNKETEAVAYIYRFPDEPGRPRTESPLQKSTVRPSSVRPSTRPSTRPSAAWKRVPVALAVAVLLVLLSPDRAHESILEWAERPGVALEGSPSIKVVPSGFDPLQATDEPSGVLPPSTTRSDDPRRPVRRHRRCAREADRRSSGSTRPNSQPLRPRQDPSRPPAVGDLDRGPSSEGMEAPIAARERRPPRAQSMWS